MHILLLSAGGGGGNILRSVKASFRRDLAVTQQADSRYADRLRRAVTTRFLDTNEFALSDLPKDERFIIGAQTTGRLGARHARIRRDSQSGRFFLIDLSSLGTTLNGRHVPRGHDEVNGAKRENGLETPLPHGARIGLAETVFLKFELGSRSG